MCSLLCILTLIPFSWKLFGRAFHYDLPVIHFAVQLDSLSKASLIAEKDDASDVHMLGTQRCCNCGTSDVGLRKDTGGSTQTIEQLMDFCETTLIWIYSNCTMDWCNYSVTSSVDSILLPTISWPDLGGRQPFRQVSVLTYRGSRTRFEDRRIYVKARGSDKTAS